MAASDYIPHGKARKVDDNLVTSGDRLADKVMIWRMAKVISNYAPPNVEQVGTVAVPIRELAALRKAIVDYEATSDAVVVDLSFWDKLVETVRLWRR